MRCRWPGDRLGRFIAPAKELGCSIDEIATLLMAFEGWQLTVRYLSRLRHSGLGRAHAGKEVRLLIADAHVRVVGIDGSLLRELVLDADRDYQPRPNSSTMS